MQAAVLVVIYTNILGMLPGVKAKGLLVMYGVGGGCKINQGIF
jgi:hypothetical protein